MEKNNTIDYRLETEIRLLATALLSNDVDVRNKIFDFVYFTTDIGKQIQEKLIEVYIRYPDGDYSVYLSALNEDEQKTMMLAMKTAVSQTVAESRVDGVLANLRELARNEKLKQDISELSITDNYTVNDVRQIVDEAEKSESVIVNSLQKYFDEYSIPVKQIATGFKILDRMLNGGIIRGTVGTIGARPSVGKTTYAVNIVANNPEIKILFFSLEMSSRMIYDKIVADIGDVDYAAAGKHEVNFETVQAILKRFDKLTIIDNVSEVERMIDIIRQVKPDLVFIDYIQIVQSEKDFESNRQRIDYISQLLKRTAKQTNNCILALSQLTRGAKEEPTMSALKESGGLEQDSDYVILLKRPYVVDKSNKEILPSDTTLKLDKNKFGDTGEIDYFFDGKHQRFSELCESGEPVARMKEETDEQTFDEDLPF